MHRQQHNLTPNVFKPDSIYNMAIHGGGRPGDHSQTAGTMSSSKQGGKGYRPIRVQSVLAPSLGEQRAIGKAMPDGVQ